MAIGRRHGLIAQALLGAPVVVVAVRRLFVCCVAVVPAPQVLRHQSLLDVLADVLVAAWRWAVPGRPQRGVQVLRHPVHLVSAVVAVHVVAMVSCRSCLVGGVDVVVSLHLVVVHVASVGVRLWLCVAGVTRDVVGCGGGPGPGLVGVTASVWLGQVGHAARVGVQVFSVAAASPTPVAVVAGGAVLHTGLAGVGGAVVQDLDAAAALFVREGEGRHRRLRLRQELGLGLQAATALAEMLRGVF